MCLYTRNAIANRAEPTFALLRYSLGGDRPSQTTQLTLFPALIQGTGLGQKHIQGGISRMAPPGPKSWFQRLPPILRSALTWPISAYSEGPRGLSVQPRVAGIFTGTSISPSRLWRQCSSGYTIHARRNLPDKEFRYLRTVIVTAALHRRFGSQLRTRLTGYLNVPTAGKRQSLYIVFRTSQRPVFLVNSRCYRFPVAPRSFDKSGGTPYCELTGLTCRVP